MLVVLAFSLAIPSLVNAQVEDDFEFYLSDIRVAGYLLVDNVSTYQKKQLSYVHFQSFLDAVEFPIVRKKNVWSGWYFSQDKQFVWKITEGSVFRSGVQPLSLSDQAGEKAWFENKEGLFVSLDNLEEWFGLSLAFNPRLQVLEIKSSELLPFQQRMERLSRAKKHDPNKYRRQLADAFVQDYYQLLTPPQVDLAVGYRALDVAGQRSYTASTLLLAGGDLLKHAAIYSGTLNHDNVAGSRDSHRLTLERRAASKDSTLWLGMNRYSFGDVYSTHSNLVTDGGSGLGVTLARGRRQSVTSLELITIAGDAPTGWDTELYRNGVLLEFGQVESDGRYVFLDQDTTQGNNQFVVKLYGPQGQVLEEQFSIWGGGLDMEKGDYSYAVNQVDFSRQLLDEKITDASTLVSKRTGDVRFSYAMTERLQVGSGYTMAKVRDISNAGVFDDMEYFTLTGRMKLGKGILLAELVNANLGGMAWIASYLGAIFDQNVRFVHKAFDEFTSPNTLQGAQLDSSTALSLVGELDRLKINSYTLRVTHENRLGGVTNTRVFNRLSKNWKQVSFSNELRYNRFSSVDGLYQGNFKVTGRYHNYNFRSQVNYAPGDSSPVHQLLSTLRWYLRKDLYNSIDITKSFQGDKVLRVNDILTWKFRDVDLSFSLAGDTGDVWAIGVGINVHFGYDRRHGKFYKNKRSLYQTGRAGIHFFIDENNNGLREVGEGLVMDVNYKHQLFSDPVTGILSIRGLPAFNPYMINTENFKFNDPFLKPKYRLYEFYTHPGSDLNVDIPLLLTGDIEGNVYRKQGDGMIGQRGFRVELIDDAGKVIDATLSEFDGYFSFHAMPGGEYQVRVLPNGQQPGQYSDRFTLDMKKGYVVINLVLGN